MIDRLQQAWQTRRVRRAYLALLQSPDGRTVLADLLAFTGVITRDTHVPGDANTSAYNAGMRRVGLRILQLSGIEWQRAQQYIQAEIGHDRDDN